MNSISDYNDSRRQFLVYLLSTGALVTLPGCTSNNQLQTLPRPEELQPGQSIYQFSGAVTVNNQQVTLTTQIKAGDVIRTSDNSYLIFVFNKDAFILRSNSHMQIPSATATGSAFQLHQGKVLSVLASRKTMITTPSAVIGIRGTGIYIESDPESSYVCTCYGTVDIATADDPGINETIIATHHEAPRYILKDASSGSRIQPAPFKDHDDHELLLIETLVGRTTPFVVPLNVTRSRKGYY